MDNLPELRDIHLPSDEIPIFPLAYGWWGLVAAVIGLVVLFKVIVWIRRTSARIYTLKLLRAIQNRDDLSAVIKMSEILRRVCVRKYPEAVALFGEKWIEFLNSKSRQPLENDAAELLKNAPFMQNDSKLYSENNRKKLWRFCYDWIGDNL